MRASSCAPHAPGTAISDSSLSSHKSRGGTIVASPENFRRNRQAETLLSGLFASSARTNRETAFTWCAETLNREQTVDVTGVRQDDILARVMRAAGATEEAAEAARAAAAVRMEAYFKPGHVSLARRADGVERGQLPESGVESS